MDTLDRYLIKEFLIFFLIAIVGITSLYVGIDFFSKFWDLELPFAKLISLYFYKIPSALERFIPVACLMASLLVLTNMSRSNEVLALYAGGIGLLRITSTFVAMVSIICTVSFITFDKLSPIFVKRVHAIEQGKEFETDATINLRRGRFWYRSENLLYNVGSFDIKNQKLENINTFLLSPSSEVVQKIHAKSAFYNEQQKDWTLKDGYIVTYPIDSHYPYSSTFESKTGVIREAPKDFKIIKYMEEAMELRDLREYIDRTKASGIDTTVQQVHYNERLALVFTPLILTILGIPFATKPLKNHSVAKSVGYCFILVFGFLLASKFSISMGKGGHLPPVIAGWGPNIIFTVYATFAILKGR